MNYQKEEFANWVDLSPSEAELISETFKWFEENNYELATTNADLEGNTEMKQNLHTIYDLLKLEQLIDKVKGMTITYKLFEYNQKKYKAIKRKSSRINQIEIIEIKKFDSNKFNILSEF